MMEKLANFGGVTSCRCKRRVRACTLCVVRVSECDLPNQAMAPVLMESFTNLIGKKESVTHTDNRCILLGLHRGMSVPKEDRYKSCAVFGVAVHGIRCNCLV